MEISMSELSHDSMNHTTVDKLNEMPRTRFWNRVTRMIRILSQKECQGLRNDEAKDDLLV
jgi:hypothetical protein